MRDRVIKVYRSWNPAAGSFAIGYHQVASHFNKCFPPDGSGEKQGNLWQA
jgi:hypothetical protein